MPNANRLGLLDECIKCLSKLHPETLPLFTDLQAHCEGTTQNSTHFFRNYLYIKKNIEYLNFVNIIHEFRAKKAGSAHLRPSQTCAFIVVNWSTLVMTEIWEPLTQKAFTKQKSGMPG